MTNTENLFELVYLLMDKKQMTARELAAHFGVSSRTVYRWVDCLSLAGIPVFATKGSGGGIGIDEGYALDKTVLTEDEKQSVVASLNAFKALTGAESSAAKKLKSLSKQNPEWLKVDFGTWSPLGRYIRTVFDILKNAILHKTIVTFDYFSTGGRSECRTVHPWKIVFRGQAWYVFGWCEARQSARYFKLSRIQNLKDIGKTSSVDIPSDLDTDEGNAYSGKDEFDNQMLHLVLKVSSSSVYRIMDEYFVEKEMSCSDEKDGEFSIINVQVPDAYWLYNWLLSFGTEIEILEPSFVKEKFANIVRQMYGRL
ncbi:MAG: YafY family transcriptional regulator [Treponema sp.]|nr:YafY family transcriptional regulator [Treponema sp.]